MESTKYTMEYLNTLGRRRAPYEEICDQLGINDKKERRTIKIMKESIVKHTGNNSVNISDESDTTGINIIDEEEIDKINLDNLTYEQEKATIKNIIDSCLDILRSESIVEYKALVNISKILLLKLIEPHLDYINMDESIENLNMNAINEESAKKVVRWNQLVALPERSWRTGFLSIWRKVLSQHDRLREIYSTDDPLSIKIYVNFVKIIKLIDKINIENTDALGDIYEDMIKNSSKGKALGQFFTPHNLKQWMVDMIEPNINEYIYDPCAGTAGFLILVAKYIINNNTDTIYEDIREYIGGREPEPDTYQLAFINCLMSTGQILDIIKGDSIRRFTEPNSKDVILTNPPFGLKVKYDGFVTLDMQEHIPIKINNGTLIFLQLCITCLKIGGRCAIVLPDGQEFFSTNKNMINVRRLLLYTCEVHGLYQVPSGTFETTGTKTLILYFTKIHDINDHLEISYIGRSGRPVKNPNYIWKGEYSTIELNMYKWTEDLIYDSEPMITANIDDLEKKKFRFNPNLYIIREKISYNNDVEIVSLGDICKFLPKSKRKASYGKKEGKYPFYTSSMELNKYVDEPDYTEEYLIMGDGGSANIKLDKNFSCSDHNYIFSTNNNKYIYYYLLNNLDLIQDKFTGSGLMNISKQNIMDLEIPLPDMEIQNKIVHYLDHVYKQIDNAYDIINNIYDIIDNNKKMMKDIINVYLQ